MKMRKMSQSPTNFHRMSPALEHQFHRERSVDACRSELFRGRTPPSAYLQADAHLGNFGIVTLDSGKPAFSSNDFDHIGYGPVDRDLKRLATSAILWSRATGADEAAQKAAVELAANSYFDTVDNAVNKCGIEPASLHLPPQQVAPNGFIQSLIDKAANGPSLQEFLAKNVKTDANGNITIAKMSPLDPEADAQMRCAISEWATRLPPERRNFTILAIGKQVGEGGSSAGLDRYSVLIEDIATNERRMFQIKTAPASSVQDQSGLNKFDAVTTIQQQRIMGEKDRYDGWVVLPNGDQYFTRENQPHKKVEMKVDTMTPAQVQEAARASGSILARAHVATIDNKENLTSWIGQPCERREALDSLYRIAKEFADANVTYTAELKAHLGPAPAKADKKKK